MLSKLEAIFGIMRKSLYRGLTVTSENFNLINYCYNTIIFKNDKAATEQNSSQSDICVFHFFSKCTIYYLEEMQPTSFLQLRLHGQRLKATVLQWVVILQVFILNLSTLSWQIKSKAGKRKPLTNSH